MELFELQSTESNVDTNVNPTDSFSSFHLPGYSRTFLDKKDTSTAVNTHELVSDNIEKPLDFKVRHSSKDTWQSIVIFTLILIVAAAKAFNQTRFKLLFKSLFNYNIALEIIREEKVFFHRANLWLSFVHVAVVSLFIYKSEQIILLNTEVFWVKHMFLMVGAVSLAYLLKFVFAQIILMVVQQSGLAREYVFHVSSYNNLLGILLIPVLLLMNFSGLNFEVILFYIAVPISAITYSMRLVRLSVAGINYRIPYLYIFLYICTLEILPLVVLYGIFIP